MSREFKRFSINKQLTMVFIIAVLLPFIVVTLILVNINQLAVRKEITYGTQLVFEYYNTRLIDAFTGIKHESAQRFVLKKNTAISTKIGHTLYGDYIESIQIQTKSTAGTPKDQFDHQSFTLTIPVLDSSMTISVDLPKLMESFQTQTVENNRTICLFNNEGKVVYQNHKDERAVLSQNDLQQIHQARGALYTFGSKNEPAYAVHISDTGLILAVFTPKDVSHYGTVKSRYRIILVLFIASAATIIAGILYGATLNRNIRQLLKAISAVKAGYYARKIHLIKNIFTPYEIVYIANEFNVMAEKIHEAWTDLNEKNRQLKVLDELKSNLISTVSHELRTPLTSIIGLTSSLIKNEEKLSKDVRIKSLKTVKKQAMLLSRMVNDLLVIPEIENATLKVIPEFVEPEPILDSVISYLHYDENRIKKNIRGVIPPVYVDGERLEQIFINLLTNAFKYAPDQTDIMIDLTYVAETQQVCMTIFNHSDPLTEVDASRLFQKFSRLNLERHASQPGTGLGLFITKGLAEAMGARILLDSSEGFRIILYLPTDVINSTVNV